MGMVNRRKYMKKRRSTKMKMRKSKHTMSSSIKNIGNEKKSVIVHMFFEMLNTVKLYHWKTRSYAQHKATDELYQRLNENIDKFVEVLLGKDQSRINMIEKKIDVNDYSNVDNFTEKIHKYRDFLIHDMNRLFSEKTDSDILSIRDDIVVDVNQFLYLMSFH
jgi:hypothetical protein